MGLALIRWYEEGEKKNDFPKFQDTDDWVRIVVFRPDIIFYYEQTPEPIEVFDDKVAFGCGADLALGAMAMGADAKRAVEIACQYNVNCGMGIDSFIVR